MREDAFSSAFRLRDELLAAGARVYAHDPYFSDEHLRERGFEPYDLDDAAAGARWPSSRRRIRHTATLAPDALPGLELFVDGRNALERAPFDAAGVAYLGIGR